MNVLITYDINKKHAEVKSAMQKLGYMDSWTVDNTRYYLPNTTLWKKETSPSQAVEDIKSVITALNNSSPNNKIKLERCISVSFDKWDGISGEPH